MTFLEETIKQRFIVAVTTELIRIQQSGGVYLNVGKVNENNQRTIKIVPILVGFALDNQEAFKIQSTRGSFKCPCSCRFCTMPNKEMYKFRVLNEILQEEQQKLSQRRRLQRRRHNSISSPGNDELIAEPKSNGDIILDYIMTSKDRYNYRDSFDNHKLTIRSEKAWFRFILHDSTEMPRGRTKLQRSSSEISDIALTVSRTIQPWINPVREIFPLITQSVNINGNTQNLLLPFDLLVPPDKLHSHDKGDIEYCFRFSMVIILLVSRKYTRKYRDNLSKLDKLIINFDIYQPLSIWGTKSERRLSGLSGMNVILLMFF
jgi:hypothetical protein